MYLIVSNEMILDICETIITWDNGCIESSRTHIGYSPKDVVTFKVEEIPENIEPYKYCYTEADGFYENPDWIDPEIAITQTPEYQAGYDQAVLDLMGEI